MKILLALEDLRTGGAQVFGMRLAQALHEQGHQVHLYTQYGAYTNSALLRQLAPDVPVLAFGLPVPGMEWFTRKLQGLLRRVGRPFATRDRLVAHHLQQVVQRLGIQVINSHTIKADYVASLATAPLAVPQVISMHGCYEDFLHKPNEPEVIEQGQQALEHAAGLVYLTAKNLEIFTQPGVRPLESLPHRQIYNGFSGRLSAPEQLPSRAQLGIAEGDMVFGMVARGIVEKGWQYALDSFIELRATVPAAHLILVGSSEYLTDLQAACPDPHVHFVGFAPNPIDWVQLFDVGLLPSYFASESLPNSIAEYLFCGAPVIATRIGEVPQMLEVPGQGLAGVLLEQSSSGLTNPAALTAAMQAYIANPALLARHRQLAQQCFDKFRMARCVAAYEELFVAVQPVPEG